ncbi:MAG: discoidin domain-containing protein [Candidatus Aminicenantes bacterium]|nr:discoidin domain-containing protein [Candidatus Aminicenantes bacterium]
MEKNKKNHMVPIVLFVILSMIMTYPLVFHMTDSVPSDVGDPLLTIWILSWTSHNFSTGFNNLWDTNIFFPHQKTLLYADHILGLSLLAAPIAALSGSFVFAYNFLFIMSFILCGCGMYALVYYLTKSQMSAVISGTIFAFFPYRFAHISHLEILFFGWMAFLFLYLHKFFNKPSIKNLMAVGVFYILQVLCCGYYGVFSTLFVALFVFYYALQTKIYKKVSFYIKLFFLSAACFLILIPFYFPYFSVHKAVTFTRNLKEVSLYSAQLQHLLSVPKWNLVWGQILGSEGSQEWQLYPGIIVILLIVFAFIKVKTSSTLEKSHKTFYGLMAMFTLLLSFGPIIKFMDKKIIPGPYMLFYKWVPGFSSLRVPSRLFALTMMALSVLAGYGIHRLLGSFSSVRKKIVIGSLAGALILLDFVSIPLPIVGIEVGDKIPAIYSSVKKLPADAALIELPMPNLGVGRAYDAIYMYYSTFHWRSIVNGYCGFNPPGYLIVREAMETFPSEASLNLLRDLEVGYVLVHSQGFRSEKGRETLLGIEKYRGQIKEIDSKNGDYLFQILPKKDVEILPEQEVEGKQNWTASSNSNLGQVSMAIDGDITTGWSTVQPLNNGDYFQLNLHSVQEVGKIELFINNKPLSYPRGYVIEGSIDGQLWEILTERPVSFPQITRETITSFSDYKTEIRFPIRRIQYLRIKQTGSHPNRRWWIHEIILKH